MAYKNKIRTFGAKGLKSRSTTTSRGPGEGPGSRSSSYKAGSGNGPRIGSKTKIDKNGRQVTVEFKEWTDANGYRHKTSKTKPHAGSPSSKSNKSKAPKSLKSKSPKPPKFPKVKSYSSSSRTSTRRRKSSGGGFGALLSALFAAPAPVPKKTKKIVAEQTPIIIDTPSELTVLQQRYNELSQRLMASQTSEDISFLYDLTFKTSHNDNIDLLKAQIAKMEHHLGKTPEVVVDTKDNVVPLFNKIEEVKEVKAEPEKKPSLILGLLLWAGIIYGLWSLFSYIF